MTIEQALQSTGLPCRYSHFTDPQKPPFLVYLGNGQDQFKADDTVYWKQNEYQVEYYFTKKNPATEETIEQALTTAGFCYEKSEDTYIETDKVFVIYYFTS